MKIFRSVCFCLAVLIGSVSLNPLPLPAPAPAPAPSPSPILLPPLSFNPDANHALAISRQNSVLNAGQSLSLGIANTLIRPLTFFNNHLASIASTLPSFMAAQGAAIGTAIAAPIQLGTLAANSLASGVTGTLVSIPVSLVTGGTAHLVGAVESGRQLVQATGVKAAQAQQNINNNILQAGQSLFRPIALIPSRLFASLSGRIFAAQTNSVPSVSVPAVKSISSPVKTPIPALLPPPVQSLLPATVKAPLTLPALAPLPAPVKAPLTLPALAPLPTPVKAPLALPAVKPIELSELIKILTPQVPQVVLAPEVTPEEPNVVQEPESQVQAVEDESVQAPGPAQVPEVSAVKSVQAPEPAQVPEVSAAKSVQIPESAPAVKSNVLKSPAQALRIQKSTY